MRITDAVLARADVVLFFGRKGECNEPSLLIRNEVYSANIQRERALRRGRAELAIPPESLYLWAFRGFNNLLTNH